MSQVKLKTIFVNDKKKDGTPYINKKGKPFRMANIVSENGNKASMYIDADDLNTLATVGNWKPGDTVDINITKSGEYTNFNLPESF